MRRFCWYNGKEQCKCLPILVPSPMILTLIVFITIKSNICISILLYLRKQTVFDSILMPMHYVLYIQSLKYWLVVSFPCLKLVNFSMSMKKHSKKQKIKSINRMTMYSLFVNQLLWKIMITSQVMMPYSVRVYARGGYIASDKRMRMF